MTELQPVSYDIWDKKYRLKDGDVCIDKTINDTFERVAKALSDIEINDREFWYEEFLYALQLGAIPAGRIMSNAGAGKYKPKTSTINCTVSDTIKDSMKGIMRVASEAALTLKAGCGVGYEFSTLRPAGAPVAGSGASTSGPLPFMQVFDAMCKTVSSAGGRRGAQMATFDIGHPDVEAFIDAKREDGNLRQFNMSLLITDEFMEAVRDDKDWELRFPLRTGKVYKTVKARDLWHKVMKSTYNYAEPGVLMIDEINRKNNLWWCENIRATNPCVSKDTWIHTSEGPRQVADIIGKKVDLIVDGKLYSSDDKGFFKTGTKPLLEITTKHGYSVKVTGDHLICCKNGNIKKWVKAGELKKGSKIVLHEHSSVQPWGSNSDVYNGPEFDSATLPIVTKEVEMSSFNYHRSFIRHLMDAFCFVSRDDWEGPKLVFYHSDFLTIQGLQRMLARIGIISKIEDKNKLVIYHANIAKYAALIGFSDTEKAKMLDLVMIEWKHDFKKERFTSKIRTITMLEAEDVYDIQVPGINAFDGNGLYLHNCGEQPLPPNGACLLGSINLVNFVIDPFSINARFDHEQFKHVVRVFTRMLDNVVEISALPLKSQNKEILRKRRHGMGITGLGSALTMLGIRYGDDNAIKFVDKVCREMVVDGYKTGVELAIEKGPAPIFDEMFMLSGVERSAKELFVQSQYIKECLPQSIINDILQCGCRFTHHTSIAPTGTISLSFGNNCSNGIEPSFAHSYKRNIIREGKKTKEQVDVYSAEMLKLIEVYGDVAMLHPPEEFVCADQVEPIDHIRMQAAAQKWIDSSISKTINVPTDYPFEKFETLYMEAYQYCLKGCTTFRFNPEVFSGVLVKQDDLQNTVYTFILEDGSEVCLHGDDVVNYDGEQHTASNLYDAIKESYYGKL
jgi:ribonucleotide reductase alpha subunit